MKNIQFVTAVHGNEPMPTLALVSMGEKQIIGNPRALARGVRYTEKDLNASFGTEGSSYEEKRASKLIKSSDLIYDVIDFHTFACDSQPFAIIVDVKQLKLAETLGVKHVVYMKHNIKAGHSLINFLPGVSVEVGNHADPNGFDLTQKIVKNVRSGKTFPVRVYEVYARIEEKGEYLNFVEKDGFIPVLYGERSYDNQGFYGLKAREITGTI